MAIPDTITIYHTRTLFHSALAGLRVGYGNMKVSGLILSVCLLLLAEQAAAGGHIETEKLGKVTFECREGWSIYNANCYKAIDVPMPYAFASLTCLGQGGLLYYPENEIEYHDFVAGLLPKTIWFGLHKDDDDGKWKIGEGEVPLENIPRWGLKQPDQGIGNASAVDPVKEVMIYDENKNLPFVCKYRACMEGYIPCDLASKCIPSEQVCNGLPECTDERDENNCPDLGKWYLHLEEETGSFQTGSVTDFTEKTWILEADVGKRIRLYVPQMNLQTNVVFVEVWSGGPTFESSEMLHRFTGSNSFIYLYSTTNFLTVRLYAIDVSTNTASYSFGWSTNIAQIPQGEKEETAITTWKGIPIPFTSEEVKPKNLMLWWRINAPEGQLITYYVQISPETGYSADDVKFDIKVYGMEESLKYRYYYTWAYNEMHVVSNFVPENGAVTLRYKLGCGMDITDTYGKIVSPHPIPNDLKCSWTLNAGQNMSPPRGMALKFYSLMLKEDTRTNPETKLEDKFMIYADGSETAITDVALYEDNLDNIIHAPGGHFKVDFESDYAFMSQGFSIGFGTDCVDLNVSAETIKSTNMTYFWENVELSCPTGFRFHMKKYFDMDTVTLRCDSMWEIDGEDPGAIPECQVVHCGPPTRIQNGGVKSSTGVTYNEKATYFCNEGFDISIGGPNATCDKDGMWTDVPTCTSSVCTVLNENILTNGKFEIIRGNDFSGSNADFNTVVEFSCDPGYEIVGLTISFCDSDGWTHKDNTPSCKKTPCAVPSIANSDVPLAGPTSPTLSGDTYLVSCNAGYKFRSTDAGSINMLCQANKTFDQTPGCEDIDECDTNQNQCQDSSTICMDTDGSYICECKPGYKRVNDFSCTDIRECDDENGGCSTRCVEEQGSYKCECDPGFKLFEGDGFNGYDVPAGETGLRRGDRYLVNHTCVRVQCPTLPPVSNGKYLTNRDSNFHFEDTVTLQCADGYQVNKTGLSGTTSFVSTCKNDGTWDELYSCEARKCSLPATPTYGVYDKTEVMFGETVILTCNLTSTKTKELKAMCIYDGGNVGFAGADITKCPEIDCGEPELVMPVGGKFFNNIGPATNTYLPSTSKFIFDCDNGFDVTGFSNDDEGNTTVRCKKNGRWNFGTLACAGKMCTDPGTPGDSKQIVNGYEIGSVLYYTCDRNGFTITSSTNYTCDYIGNDAVWSNNLAGNLPECIDTENPTFSGSCGQTYNNIDAVDRVFFTPGTASDNFAVASFSRTDPLQSGDRLLVDTSVTYTARDFQGNEETCTVTFNVIDRTVKPTLGCPPSKTISVSGRDSEAYNTSSEISVSGGTLQVSPSSLAVSVSKIGTADIVTATAEDQHGRESSCTFMVDYVANACFQEQIFVDNNAVRDCNEVGGNLVCESTCKIGYIFSDKTSAKNFTCSGTGNWDYTSTLPHDRFCLLKENPEYIVSVDLIHTYEYISGDCLNEYRNSLTNNIPTFEQNILSRCNQQWDVSVNTAEKGGNFFEFETTLDLKLLSSVSVSESEDCINKIVNTTNNVFDVTGRALFCAAAGQSYDLTVKEDSVISGTGALSCLTVGYSLVDDICLPCGPAQFFNSETKSVNACPDGQYQDGFAQTSCKNCSSGQYPNSDKTVCQVTCPRGFRSDSGFYPCTACGVDTYWTAKDTCTQCPGAQSTVGIEGAADETKCIEPCPKGKYSRTGYDVNGCTSCPVNFYQDDTAQMTCKRCSNNQRTSTTGSISSSNCTDVADVCDRTTCNDNGACSYERGDRECSCDTGYYGDRCQNMYHICDGNPCTNGAACVRGATPTEYTCTCRTDLDICEMDVQEDAKVGSQGLASQLTTFPVSNLQGCKSACLNNNECKEASFLSTSNFCVLYNAELLASELNDESNTDDQHLRKTCNIAFGGDRCEQDTKNDCENAGCHENSQCMDKINGFECICPSAGGYTGNLCTLANNPCSPNPCERGTCRAFGSVRYECTCPDGYKGLNCEINIDECALYPDACPYGGECSDRIDDYTCSCSSGFSGPFCENTPNFCNNHDCSGDNVCYNSLDRMEGVCVCDTELFVPRYRCAMNVVQNESAVDQQANTVTSSVFLFTIDACKDLCQNNPDCIIATFTDLQDNTGRYICAQYNSSFESKTDSASVAIYKNCNSRPAEAYACDQEKFPCDNVDCNNGTCLNINNNLDSFCDCDEGYTGFRCQHSRDDCVGNQCENGAECIDGHLTYTCNCKPGFNGNRCENDIDDCPGSCNTTNGRCEDRVSDYECICNDGFVGDTCNVEINECSSYPCEHGGTCTDEVNGFTCDCPDGWEGDRCENQINNCVGRAPCLNGGECFSLPTSARCRCEGGATGDNCENATLLCDTLSNLNVCINEGVCVNGEGTATCSCPVVYDTQRCFMQEGMVNKQGGNIADAKIPLASGSTLTAEFCKNNCLNNRICHAVSFIDDPASPFKFCRYYTVEEETLTDSENSIHFRRFCPTDFQGKSCEIVKDWCAENPCKNEGICKPVNPVGYECECMPGYSGPVCETAADPCKSDPCRGQAKCQSTPTEYICQCEGGKVWTGTSCKTSRTDYTMLVNAAMGQQPPTLQTTFRLSTNELSVMMKVKIHHVNTELPLATLFALLVTPDLELPDSIFFDFSLTVSIYGIYVTYGLEEAKGIPFTEDFGKSIFDGEWHHVGIAIDSEGMLSATIDSLHVEDLVDTGRNLSLDYNAQISLGYGYIIEYEDVEVYDVYLERKVFSNALAGNKPSENPIQRFDNFNFPPSAKFSMDPLQTNIIKNPNLVIPELDCSKMEDIYYASDMRLTLCSSIPKIADMYDSVTSVEGEDLTYYDTVDSTLTRGYYPVIFIGKNETTKNYGQCRSNLYVRYNSKCPSMDGLFSASVESRPCSDTVGGYCDVKCDSSQAVISAPTPYYITCGSLGVYDYRTPFAETYYPACEAAIPAKYQLDVSMQFMLEITCTNIPDSTLSRMDEEVRSKFVENIKPRWNNICEGDCTNLIDVQYKCGNADNVFVEFSLVLTSLTLEAAGGGSADVEDVLKIVIKIENLLDISTISGATLVVDSVVINRLTVCGTGHRQESRDDAPICVPCSEGYYLTNHRECKPCDYGYYQDNKAQTECKKCDNDKTTYSKGVRDAGECKEICQAGFYYDKDEDKCMACMRHFYQHEEGKNFCIECRKEYKTAANASDSENDCKEDCPAGKERSVVTGECDMCERGYWRSLTFDDCQKCPENTTTYLNELAETEDDCEMDICELGEYFDREQGCKPCDHGFYQDEMLMLSCKDCPGNMTTRDMGADNKTLCEFYCPVGYERNGTDEVCLPCKRGFYKDNVGDNKFEPCKQCPTDTTDMMGSISVANCSIPVCSKGEYIDEGVCKPCPQDSYSDVELPNTKTTCMKCGPFMGTLLQGSTSDECMSYCVAGKFLNGQTCESCARGYYKDNDGNTRFDNCTKCPPKDGKDTTTDDLGSDDQEACSVYKCAAGSISSENGCKECEMNTFQPKEFPFSTDTCLPCPVKAGLITNTRTTGTDKSADCLPICDAGKYLSGTSCMSCARGTYKENVGDARFGNCSDCPGANTTENTGADRSALCNIQKCEAGEYLENKACKKCELDTYSEVVNPNSDVKCIACGTINGVVYGTENTGADNSSLCKPTCTGGKQFDSATNRCTDCPIESFKGDDDRFGSCTLCETVKPGYVSSVAGAKTSDQCDLRNCPAGEKIVGSSCVKCEVGTYQSEPRKTTCIDCGENLSTDGEGKTSKDDCQIECGPGLQGSDICIPCPLGTFKTVSGYANCQDCPLDFTSNEARTECDVVFCSKGKEYTVSGSTESCEECPVGFFKDQTGNNMKCTQCPTGSTTNGTGQTTCDLLNCVPGKYKLGSKCEVCPVGTYKSDPGNQECTDCTDKTTTGDVTGAISSTQCDTVICDPGSYRQKDQKLLCTQCEIGKYQPSSGQTSCEDCPNDEITLGTGKSSMDACVPECEAGQEYNSTTKQCFLCPTGTFKVSVGNTDSCQMCPKDKTTAGPGGKAEADCSQNKCPPGKYFKVSADKIVECFDCEIGTYSDREMQASCTDCPNQGTTQRNGTDSEEMCIKACAAGYGYRTDIGDCEICPKGQYNDKKGQNPNSCKQCPFGKTNSQSGSGSCNFLDIKPPVDQRINLIVVTTVRVALDTCDTTAAIDLIKENFLQLVRNVFLKLTNQCYNGSQRYCRGTNCDNIVFASLNPTCQQITGGKRDISHELSFELHLENISEFITDECDGNANVTAVEVISQILTLYKEELTDIDLEIIFMSFENVTTVDLCGLGEELVNGICTPCPAGKYGSSVGTCTACAANTYQDMTGKTGCKDCPDKSFTESTGSTSDSQCIPICQAGNEFDSATKTCSECEIGFFKVEEGNDQACTACISGKTTPRKGSTSADDCSKTLCQPGEYYITDTDTGDVSCRLCEIGKYNPNVMAESCEQCGNDKTTQAAGRKSENDCIEICPSGSGYDTDEEKCLNCPKGQYNDGLQPRPNMCKYCPDRTTTFKDGESSCTTVVTPVPRKLVIIKKIMIFAISIDNCGSTDSLNQILTRISVTIRQLFIRNRNEKYSALLSFCVGDCINLSVRFPNNNPALACRLKGSGRSGRRKRETTHEMDVELEFNNVSESTVDTQNNAALSTEEVISQIINNNRDDLSLEQGQIEYQRTNSSVVSVLCSPGEESVNNECVACRAGRYSTDGGSCELCPRDTYQDESGQSSCENCPAKTFNDAEGATSSSQCKSWCVNNPGYCNNRGICSDTGRRTASCSCYDNYEGAQCASKKEPSSDMPAILGGAIGGGGALLIIILIIVGVFMRCSRDPASDKRKTKQYYDPEYIHNGAYEGTYDNFGYHGGQARPVAPYPSVGYPALGYKPDQSFEEGTYSRPYKYRPSIDGDDMGRPNDDSHFVWTA